MFTGIVQNLGVLIKKRKGTDGFVFDIKSTLPIRCFKVGNSIAVQGVCLTVEAYEARTKVFTVTAVQETLSKTTLALLEVGDLLNLEPALTLNSFLGGHLVSGHVDGLGVVVNSAPDFIIEAPSSFMKFFPQKGSITVNGVSLTIASVSKNRISIAVIPETLKKTSLGSLEKGDSVNLEIDLIARYLERLSR